MSMKKEIERLQEEYKDVLKGNQIYLEIEKSDALDNRSPRMYRVSVGFGYSEEKGMVDVICEVGFCRHKENIIERFENRLKERRG